MELNSKNSRIVEQFWSCPYCGTKDIRGRYRECPSCGRPRGEHTKFEVKNPRSNYISDEEARDIEKAGLAAPSKEPDWYCEYCNTLNSAKDSTCRSCGASKMDSSKNYFDLQKKEEKPRREEASGCSTPVATSTPGTLSSNRKRNKQILQTVLASIMVVLASSAVIGGLWWIFSPKKDTLDVVSVGWERSISIEEQRTFEESGWSLPSGARLKTSKNEIYEYVQVLDHYETVTEVKTRQVVDHYEEYVVGYRDLGNGYAEEITAERPVYKTETYTETHEEPVYRSEPVYRTKYYYEIDKWVKSRSVDTEGVGHEPYFGEYTLKEGERKGGESSTYFILAVNKKGESKRYYLPYEEWMAVNEKDVLQVIVHAGRNIEITSKNGDAIAVEMYP